MTALKFGLADSMLLGMVKPAEADAPAIGRLQPHAPIGTAADMRAFYLVAPAIGNAALMAPDPGTMAGNAAASD